MHEILLSSYAFAKSIIEDDTLWCERLESGILKNQLFAKFKTDRVLERATLVHTKDSGFTGHRKWKETEIRLTKKNGFWLADWPLPKDTTGWFVNVEADGLVVSSDYHSGS